MNATFQQSMHDAGIDPPDELLADGALHRFSSGGDRSPNSWYILYGDDPAAGGFGCWKRGISKTWCARAYVTLTSEEKTRYAAKMEAAKRQRDAELSRLREECRTWCADTWNKAKDATRENPYIKRKGINAYGLKSFKDTLLVPVMDMEGNIHGLQFIAPDGTKKFKTGTAKSGNSFTIGERKNNTVIICEGYATGASLHEATGHQVLVAFDSGNLKPVAQAVRAKFPSVKIIIAGDNDSETPGNPGLTKATEAAQAVNGSLAIPVFTGVSTNKRSDWNDLHVSAGKEEVALQLAAVDAEQPPAAENQWPEPISMKELSDSEPEPPRFIIPGWLPAGYATLLAGHGGIGKSGISLILAVCIAMGLAFFGVPVDRRKVMYMSCEDRIDVLHWKLSWICKYLGISISNCIFRSNPTTIPL